MDLLDDEPCEVKYKIGGLCEVTAKIRVSVSEVECRPTGLFCHRFTDQGSTYFGLPCINVVDSRPSSVRRARESSLKARIDRTAYKISWTGKFHEEVHENSSNVNESYS